MQAFLEVQKSTMLAYLAGRGSPSSVPGSSEPAPDAYNGERVAFPEHGARSRLSPRNCWSHRTPVAASGCPRLDHDDRADGRSVTSTRTGPTATATARHGPPHAPRARQLRHRIARRSPRGCSRPSAIGPATRSRPWGSTSIWKPTWESTRSSGSRSWGSCATSFRLEGPVGFRRR